MSDYTPTTEKMFEAYYNFLRHTSRSSRDAQAEFDRWLAEVKADAWEEGALDCFNTHHLPLDKTGIVNPYRGENK